MDPKQILKDSANFYEYYSVRKYVGEAFLKSFEMIESSFIDGLYTEDKAVQELINLYKPFEKVDFQYFYVTNAGKVINSIQDAEKTAERIGGQEGKNKFIDGIISIFNVRKYDKIFDKVNEIMFDLSLMVNIDGWYLYWSAESDLYDLPSQINGWSRDTQ